MKTRKYQKNKFRNNGQLDAELKRKISKGVAKVIKDYSGTLIMLGKE